MWRLYTASTLRKENTEEEIDDGFVVRVGIWFSLILLLFLLYLLP